MASWPPVCNPQPTGSVFLSKSLLSSEQWSLCLQNENEGVPHWAGPNQTVMGVANDTDFNPNHWCGSLITFQERIMLVIHASLR